MWDWMFEIIETGEEILVECENLEKAKDILKMNGFAREEVKFLDRYTIEEGEMMGLDTY